MGEIDRGDLEGWKAVTQAYLLSDLSVSRQPVALPDDHRRDQPAWNPLRRSGKDRFLSRARQQLFLLLRDAGRQEECTIRRLERTFHAHVSFIATRPDIPRRILSWSLHSADTRLRRRVRKVVLHYELRVNRLIAEGQQQGCIREDIEPRAATSLFVSMLQNLVLRLPDDRLEPEVLVQDANRLFRTYIELIRPPAPRTGPM